MANFAKLSCIRFVRNWPEGFWREESHYLRDIRTSRSETLSRLHPRSRRLSILSFHFHVHSHDTWFIQFGHVGVMHLSNYKVFGLVLQSEVPLPRGTQVNASECPDVWVKRASIGSGLDEGCDEGGLWQAAPDRFFIAIDGVAKFLVKRGEEILVERCAESEDAAVISFLLGSVMGALLHQRGLLPLHASAVQTDQGAVLLAGASGAGKSTILAALHQRGYPMITDDIAALELSSEGGVLIAPAFPRIKITAGAAALLSIDVSGSVKHHAKGKYLLPVSQFASERNRVRHIFLLGFTGGETVSSRRVEGGEAVGMLFRATYRRRFLKGLGRRESHFSAINQLANDVPITSILRPAMGSSLAEIMGKIESLL